MVSPHVAQEGAAAGGSVAEAAAAGVGAVLEYGVGKSARAAFAGVAGGGGAVAAAGRAAAGGGGGGGGMVDDAPAAIGVGIVIGAV